MDPENRVKSKPGNVLKLELDFYDHVISDQQNDLEEDLAYYRCRLREIQNASFLPDANGLTTLYKAHIEHITQLLGTTSQRAPFLGKKSSGNI